MRNNQSYAIAILTAGILCGDTGSPTQSPSGADEASTKDNSTSPHKSDASKVNDGKGGEGNGAATTADSRSDSSKAVDSSDQKRKGNFGERWSRKRRPTTSPDEASIQAPTSKGDLVLAATHIKEAWHRQIPFTKLTPFELKTYQRSITRNCRRKDCKVGINSWLKPLLRRRRLLDHELSRLLL